MLQTPYRNIMKCIQIKRDITSLIISGDVKFAELKTDENGRSKGFGTVRFGTPEDARRAVSILLAQKSMVYFSYFICGKTAVHKRFAHIRYCLVLLV